MFGITQPDSVTATRRSEPSLALTGVVPAVCDAEAGDADAIASRAQQQAPRLHHANFVSLLLRFGNFQPGRTKWHV